MGSSDPSFFMNVPFFQDGVYKSGELLSTLQKKKITLFTLLIFNNNQTN